MTPRRSVSVLTTGAVAILLSFAFIHAGAPSVAAQTRDSLLNGGLIGAGVGAGIGVVVTHATRDSDLTAGQYARDAAVFAAIGAGAGLGLDALLTRSSPRRTAAPRLMLTPAFWRRFSGVTLHWQWGG